MMKTLSAISLLTLTGCIYDNHRGPQGDCPPDRSCDEPVDTADPNPEPEPEPDSFEPDALYLSLSGLLVDGAFQDVPMEGGETAASVLTLHMAQTETWTGPDDLEASCNILFDLTSAALVDGEGQTWAEVMTDPERILGTEGNCDDIDTQPLSQAPWTVGFTPLDEEMAGELADELGEQWDHLGPMTFGATLLPPGAPEAAALSHGVIAQVDEQGRPVMDNGGTPVLVEPTAALGDGLYRVTPFYGLALQPPEGRE